LIWLRATIEHERTERTKTAASADVLWVSEGVSIREGLTIDSVDLVAIILRVEDAYRIRLMHE